MITLSLTDIARTAFGQNQARYMVPRGKTAAQVVQPQYAGLAPITEEEIDDETISAMGTPILDQVILYDLPSSAGFEGNVWEMPSTTLMVISQAVNRVDTTIDGRNGTVKELIGLGDVKIQFAGYLVNTGKRKPPYALAEQLWKIHRLAVPIKATSVLLSKLLEGNEDLVFEEPTIEQMEGVANAYRYSWSAVSDRPLEVIIKDRL